MWAELCINRGTSNETGLRRRRQEELQIYCDNIYPLSDGDVTGTGGTSSTSTGGGLYLGDMTDWSNRVYIRNMLVDESLGLNKVYNLAGKTHKVGLLEQSKKRKKQFEVLSSLVTESGKEMGRNIIIDNETSIKKIEESNKILEEYKVKEKALSVACKVLSPDEGLIAKSINGFITVIVNEMNKINNQNKVDNIFYSPYVCH